MKPRTGAPQTVSRNLLYGVLRPYRLFGDYEKFKNRSPLKRQLQTSKRRKTPITLPTTPFDHRGEQ